MVTVPAETPVTRPVAETVATDGLLVLHVPPGVALVSKVEELTHTDELPMMGAMVLEEVTVTVFVAEQPATV
jgi:hypothetical protein